MEQPISLLSQTLQNRELVRREEASDLFGQERAEHL